MNRCPMAVCLLVGIIAFADYSLAWAYTGVVRRAVNAAVRTAAREGAEEVGEATARQAASLVARYGDDAAKALKRLGPKAAKLIDEAGPAGQSAAKLLSRYGDDAAWVVRHRKALDLFTKYGDDAGEALVRHGEMVIPLIDDLGQPAARALSKLNGQNARRLVMLHRSGDLQKAGPHRDDVIDVIIRYGDKAMDFIWRNKGALFVGATLVAFVSDPEAFLNAGVHLVGTAVHATGEAVGTVVSQAAPGLLTILLLPAAVVGGLLLAGTLWFYVRPWLWRILAPRATPIREETPQVHGQLAQVN